MIALDGSPIGVGGTSTRPAPIRVRVEPVERDEPVRRELGVRPLPPAVRALAEGAAAGTDPVLRAGPGAWPALAPPTGAVGALRAEGGRPPPGGAATMVGTVAGRDPGAPVLAGGTWAAPLGAGEPQVSQ